MSIKKVARLIAVVMCLFAVSAPASITQASGGGAPPPPTGK
jgi:hypothetical protein